MAWLEREATEKGRRAADVRRRLAEVVTGLGFDTPPARLTRDEKKGEGEEESTTEVFPTRTHVPEKEALQRIGDSFSPYFAVISSPIAVRRLRDQFFAARRAQSNGLNGAPADVVGLPLFSQFSTWREAYQNRNAWDRAPFSFFLVHDTSYNNAQISSLFVMLDAIMLSSHTHSATCLFSKRKPIHISDAQKHFTNTKAMRHDVDQLRAQCPLFSIQQLTEDLILIFEQANAKNTLSTVSKVILFLTECVLDAEMARRFFHPKSLMRQAELNIPVPPSTAPKQSVDGEDGAETAGAALNTDLAEIFDKQNFTTEEFESLFDLVPWFIDNPFANSYVPIECDLLPTAQYILLEEISDSVNRSPPQSRSRSPEMPSTSYLSASVGSRSPRVRTSLYQQADRPSSRPSKHQYIPGKTQVFTSPDSLVEVITKYSAQREALIQGNKGASDGADVSVTTKKHPKKGKGGIDGPPPLAPLRPRPDAQLSLSATCLSSPMIVLSTYIRLHGAPWLKHLLDRLFNVLRKESVLLYVNRIDLEHPGATALTDGLSASVSHNSFSVSLELSGETPMAVLRQRMERLEDLICQDIQYVMSELFNALYGERSTTRLPQGITVLLTQFCAAIHVHLLGNTILTAERVSQRPGSAARQVQESVQLLKKKRMALHGTHKDYKSDMSTARLLLSIERYRLVKFILFDSWIIPSLNNAVDEGYLSESTSLHLRWNVDAFARYLKILVNAPFSRDSVRAAPRPPPPLPPAPTASSGKKPRSSMSSKGNLPAPTKSRVKKKDLTAPQVLPLPPFITGIYDVSSGTLVRLYSDPLQMQEESYRSNPVMDVSVSVTPAVSRTILPGVRRPLSPGGSSQSLGMSMGTGQSQGREMGDRLAAVLNLKYHLYRSVDDASWDQIPTALKSLNESLGIVNYDPEEEEDERPFATGPTFHAEGCAMRVLDLFCSKTSSEQSDNVVVSEFGVLPSVAAGCVDKVYDLVTGKHPAMEMARASGKLPCKLPISLYLSCLSAVLLHPVSASEALDNIYKNSKRFYRVLMSPLKDQSMLSMISALVEERDDLPLVDTNALTPLLTTVTTSRAKADHNEAQQRLQAEVEKVRKQQHFLSAGVAPPQKGVSRRLLNIGPSDPMNTLTAGRDRIVEESGVTPLCFDPWWKAMTLALCVRAMSVLSECGTDKSVDFLEKCRLQLGVAKAESKVLTEEFIESKGQPSEPTRANKRRSKASLPDAKEPRVPAKRKTKKSQ
ncbi:hypothetical protein AGDE_12980 [Angomonas deanei]|uniref:Uncharacterized protein n=1 Tax=Angomonas deanei TaxID=59799 RepID=A0A7G2CBX8_9TRYP|nr:hypothetical protein AGDE_12980 [Angomonas deanei]CAD2216531.1 hypothetical protein, conserved [Angomonas deanei]|eukprot:EPY23137.1 hypothetical protein AGDE_12980 [Angomonas deanei]